MTSWFSKESFNDDPISRAAASRQSGTGNGSRIARQCERSQQDCGVCCDSSGDITAGPLVRLPNMDVLSRRSRSTRCHSPSGGSPPAISHLRWRESAGFSLFEFFGAAAVQDRGHLVGVFQFFLSRSVHVLGALLGIPAAWPSTQ